MFKDLKNETIKTSEVDIFTSHGGIGQPLLLIHGYPQTNVMWHKLVVELSKKFYIVCPDLRGYGKSSKPSGNADHSNYSKRAMAKDMIEVMEQLGFDTFFATGHDRGGRVLHRMCLDYEKKVTKACVMDIAPTHHMFTTADKEFATGYYHWFFLIQPDGLPEKMIGKNPTYYLKEKLRRWSGPNAIFDPLAVEEYIKCFNDPRAIHGSCEDYRAAANIDLLHDEEDMDKKVLCPLLVLWGNMGFVHKKYDLLETWRERASDVRGYALDCGHFLPEESPVETLEAMLNFFS